MWNCNLKLKQKKNYATDVCWTVDLLQHRNEIEYVILNTYHVKVNVNLTFNIYDNEHRKMLKQKKGDRVGRNSIYTCENGFTIYFYFNSILFFSPLLFYSNLFVIDSLTLELSSFYLFIYFVLKEAVNKT